MSEKEPVSRIMTVARILESDTGDQTEVVFLESAMFFKLPRENHAFDRVIASLRSAFEKGIPVEVRLRSLDSDMIEDVRAIN